MSFLDNLDAFSEALGVENAPTIVYMSLVPWPSANVRNDFIYALTNRDMRFADAAEE
jgi:hypothetical protein